MTRQWLTDEMRAQVRRDVATWPPLTPEQRDRLYVLLAPMRAWLKTNASGKAGAA